MPPQKQPESLQTDLQALYRATTQAAAETALDELEAKWGKSYPLVIRFWRDKWVHLSACFKYPEYVRKAIYYHTERPHQAR